MDVPILENTKKKTKKKTPQDVMVSILDIIC